MQTTQALSLIGRLMRSDSKAAAHWIMGAGLDEEQTKMLGELIARSPFFGKRNKPQSTPSKARCPGCGNWFVYMRTTRRKMWCSAACRMRANRQQHEAAKKAHRHLPGVQRNTLSNLARRIDIQAGREAGRKQAD